MVELGSMASTYEAYNGTTYAVDWTDEAGTVYGGTLDLTTGVLTVTHGFKVYDGSENWSLNNPSKPWLFTVPAPSDIRQGSASSLYEISNLFQATSEIWTNSGYGILNNFNNLLAGYPDANGDVDVLKTFLANNNLQVCYELATPVTYNLTPTQVRAIVGTNNIWSDTGSVEVKFKDTVQNYIDKKIAATQALIL